MWFAWLGVALAGDWEVLAPGLELGTFPSPVSSIVGDGTIRVVRIDPTRFDLTLVTGPPKTAADLATDHHLVAVINAGMFEPDRTATFEMRGPNGVNNPSRSPKAGSFLVFDPLTTGATPVRLLDRGCDDIDAVGPTYRALVQGFRLLTCAGTVTWKDGPKIWSHAVFGIDGQGRPLLIHVRSPYNTAEMTRILVGLPLDLKRLMYLEGGPEATLALDVGTHHEQWVGSYETGFHESDDNHVAWPIPNVIGVVPRP